MKRASVSPTAGVGDPVNLLRTLMLVSVVVFGMAGANRNESAIAPDSVSPGSSIIREGIVYTPVSIGSRGCVLYHIRIPGGQAPAALVYQSTVGQFSYARPDQCVKEPDAL